MAGPIDAVSALRQIAPAIVWAPLLWPPAIALLAWGTTAFTAWQARRFIRAPDEHWTEWARRTYRFRQRAVFLLSGLFVLCAAAYLSVGALSPAPALAIALASLGAGVAAASGPWNRLIRSFNPTWPTSTWAGAVAGTSISIGSLIIGVIALALVPVPLGVPGLAVLAVALPLMVAHTWTGGIPLRLWLGLLKPGPAPRAQAAVDRAAARLGVPSPAVVVLERPYANARAVPTVGRLLFTSRLLDELDDAGLEAIALHELRHLQELPTTTRDRVTRTLIRVLPIPFYGLAWHVSPVLLVAVVVISWTVPLLGGAPPAVDLSGDDDPAWQASGVVQAYARALERLHEINLVPAVLDSSAGQPDIHQRLEAAGLTPSWPRPSPPPARSRAVLPAIVGLSMALGVSGARLAEYRNRSLGWNLAFASSEDLRRMASTPGVTPEMGLTLLEAAAQTSSEERCDTLRRADIEARAHRCAEGRADLAEALPQCPELPTLLSRTRQALSRACRLGEGAPAATAAGVGAPAGF